MRSYHNNPEATAAAIDREAWLWDLGLRRPWHDT